MSRPARSTCERVICIWSTQPNRTFREAELTNAIAKGDSKLLDVDLLRSFVVEMTRVERQVVHDSLQGFQSALQESRNVSGGDIAILSCPGIF